MKKLQGFTLTELMITIAIVAILSAIAIPNYRSYIERSNRTDATRALLNIAANQEKFYLQNNAYSGAVTSLGYADAVSTEGLYDLAVNLVGNGFEALATTKDGASQASDDECATFTINHLGTRGAGIDGSVDYTDADVIAECWR